MRLLAGLAILAEVAMGLGLASCGGLRGGANSIVVYNGQHPQLTQAIVSAFERQSGIHVDVRSDDGVVLADEILQEGSHSPADVYLAENSPELTLLSEHQLLAPLPAATLARVSKRYESPAGNWVGIALRVSALAYDPSLVSAAQLPPSLLDLAEPAWRGRVAIAPTDSDFLPLVGAVIATDGKQRALSWLRGLKANSTLYADDESVVAAVNKGQAAVGIINQYYWYRLRLEQGPSKTPSRLYFFPNHDVGSLENISGAAVLRSSHHQGYADRFVAFLVSPTAQHILAASDDFEYPVLPGVAPNSALPPLSSLQPAVISTASLGDDQRAASLLLQAGLT
jgi:iron(III) transport system substrate-binding protein